MPLLSAYYEPRIWLGAINTGRGEKIFTYFCLNSYKGNQSPKPKTEKGEEQERKRGWVGGGGHDDNTISYEY